MRVAAADGTHAPPPPCDRAYQCANDVDVNGNEALLLMGVADSRLPVDAGAARLSKNFTALESARALYNLESSPAQSPRRKPPRRPLSAYASPLVTNYAQSTDGSSHPSSLESLAIGENTLLHHHYLTRATLLQRNAQVARVHVAVAPEMHTESTANSCTDDMRGYFVYVDSYHRAFIGHFRPARDEAHAIIESSVLMAS